MTPHSTPESDATTSLSSDDDVGQFGSSVYAGRPTFALVRHQKSKGASLTLYELLPEAHAKARQDRFKRSDPHNRLITEPFDATFGKSTATEVERWDWENWTAAKVARLFSSQLRAVLPLMRETLADANHEESTVLSSGNSDVFLSETPGVRLTLGFRGVKPIRRVDRMRALCRGVARMSDQECYYWYAKCRAPSSPSGEKALRTLLTDHL